MDKISNLEPVNYLNESRTKVAESALDLLEVLAQLYRLSIAKIPPQIDEIETGQIICTRVDFNLL